MAEKDIIVQVGMCETARLDGRQKESTISPETDKAIERACVSEARMAAAPMSLRSG